MPFLGSGTPSHLQGYVPNSNPYAPSWNSQPTEGMQVNRERLRFEDEEGDETRGFQAAQAGANRAQEQSLLAANLGFQGQQADANRGHERGMFDANLGFQGSQADMQRRFQGDQAGLDRSFQGEQNAADRSNQQTIAAMPWDYRRQVFGTISPLLQGLLGGAGGSMRAGGTPGEPPPPTTNATVWDAGQIQSQINDQKATSAQAASTQERANAARVAGSGFGSNSPLLMALNNNVQSARMAGDSAAELATSLGASEANARLGVEQARTNAQNYATQTDAITRQRQSQLGYQSSLVAALAGMIGG
jgi:hypothetical protein